MGNIVLIGYSGSGKTVIGRNLARMLGFEFADFDEMIKDRTGLLPPQLLKKYGVIRYCSEEKLLVNKLAAGERQVVSLGGHTLLPPEQLQPLAAGGMVVLLAADPSVIHERLNRKETRRSLEKSKMDIDNIETGIAAQAEKYGSIVHLSINTSEIGVEEAAKQIAVEFEAKKAEYKAMS